MQLSTIHLINYARLMMSTSIWILNVFYNNIQAQLTSISLTTSLYNASIDHESSDSKIFNNPLTPSCTIETMQKKSPVDFSYALFYLSAA